VDVRLDGKVALVTGASKGIGLAIAREMARSGAKVMISSRKAAALEAAAAAIGEGCAWFAANAGDPAAAKECVSAAVARFGALDILVNNAGANPYMGRLIDIPLSAAEKTVQVNQQAVVVWTKAAWDASMRERGGAVVNISSVGGIQAGPAIGYYNVTKAAVIHLTRHLAAELGPGVRVNAIAPGLVKTDFARALWGASEADLAARLPLRRLGEPEDVAKVAVFVASDAAAWMTGSTIVVDGGALAGPPG